jgi:hypothetical protein
MRLIIREKPDPGFPNRVLAILYLSKTPTGAGAL